MGNPRSCRPDAPREVRFLADSKMLVSVSEAEMRIAVLADITMVQGETSSFRVQIPEGYEVTGVTGPTLDSAETQPSVIKVHPDGTTEPDRPYIFLTLSNPSLKNHQFLISMERSIKRDEGGGAFRKLQRSAKGNG